jgi:hypothetical protein
VSHSPTLPLSYSTSISSHYGSHSAMAWRWNNAVENYVLINRLLPQVQKTLWICAENILNSRLSILSKIAHWLRHRRGDVGRPPFWRIVCSSLQIMKNTANQRSARHRTENCSNIIFFKFFLIWNRSLQFYIYWKYNNTMNAHLLVYCTPYW